MKELQDVKEFCIKSLKIREADIYYNRGGSHMMIIRMKHYMFTEYFFDTVLERWQIRVADQLMYIHPLKF